MNYSKFLLWKGKTGRRRGPTLDNLWYSSPTWRALPCLDMKPIRDQIRDLRLSTHWWWPPNGWARLRLGSPWHQCYTDWRRTEASESWPGQSSGLLWGPTPICHIPRRRHSQSLKTTWVVLLLQEHLYWPLTRAQSEPPAETLTILPLMPLKARRFGTFSCLSLVMVSNCEYSELPQPKTSPFSSKFKTILIEFFNRFITNHW